MYNLEMGSIKESLEKYREDVLRLSKVYGMLNPRVFGSVSRGELSPNDLDILVQAEPGRSYFDLIDYSEALEGLLGIPVDVVTEGGLSPFLREEILNSARAL